MGLSSRFSTVAVALLGSTLLLPETLAQELIECSASSTAGFDYEVTLGTDFDVRWSLDTATETISFEVFSPAQAWVSLGFSSDGMMIGADAVIGLPGDNAVAEWDLTGKTVDMVLAFEEQEITGGSVTQDDLGTTLTFTRPLAPTDSGKETLSATPGDQHWLIFAFGSGNELAYHGPDENRGAAMLDLFCGEDGVGSESSAPSASPATSSPLSEGDTPSPSEASVGGGGGDGGEGSTMSVAPTVVPEAEEEEDSPTGAEDTDAALRVSGGLWAAAATVTAAMLGAAMSL